MIRLSRPRTPLLVLALLLFSACDDGPTGIEPGDVPRRTVASGTDHSCALASDGAAYCWGSNRVGQLGAPDVEIWSWTPVAVAGGRSFASIDVATTNNIYGPYVSCALTGSGEAYCWGTNENELIAGGDETCGGIEGDTHYNFPCVRSPTRVAPGIRFAQISVGAGFICGVTGEGEAWCWGKGEQGQLGNGQSVTSAAPVRVSGGHRFAMVSAGDRHACALAADGGVWCWGENVVGQLGDGTTTRSASPVSVDWPGKFILVDAGDVHTCAIDGDRRAVCWGSSAGGRLGAMPTPMEPLYGPIAVRGGFEFRWLGAGLGSACGITAAGATMCWGAQPNGESSIDPILVGGTSFDQVSLGYLHGCGRAPGGVYCWGDNLYVRPGQLGVGEQVEFSSTPLLVSLP